MPCILLKMRRLDLFVTQRCCICNPTILKSKTYQLNISPHCLEIVVLILKHPSISSDPNGPSNRMNCCIANLYVLILFYKNGPPLLLKSLHFNRAHRIRACQSFKNLFQHQGATCSEGRCLTNSGTAKYIE